MGLRRIKHGLNSVGRQVPRTSSVGPRTEKRNQGILITWCDDVKIMVRVPWIRISQDRQIDR